MIARTGIGASLVMEGFLSWQHARVDPGNGDGGE